MKIRVSVSAFLLALSIVLLSSMTAVASVEKSGSQLDILAGELDAGDLAVNWDNGSQLQPAIILAQMDDSGKKMKKSKKKKKQKKKKNNKKKQKRSKDNMKDKDKESDKSEKSEGEKGEHSEEEKPL